MCNLENMLQNFITKQSSGDKSEQTVTNQSTDKQKGQSEFCHSRGKRGRFPFESSDEESVSDILSVFAAGQISPERSVKDVDKTVLEENNNYDKNDKNLSVSTKTCLFEMFGEDAVVKKVEQKKDIV